MNRFLSISIFFLAYMSLSLFAGETPQEPPDDNEEVIVYKFDIKRMIAAPVWRATQVSLKEAREIGADYILIHMNTYGGQVDMADSIRTAILNFPKPVLVFIDNQAISAGALISIACDSIYMRPGGSIGAATVVDQTGQQVPDKYQSFMRGMMRSTAEAHGKKPVVINGDTSYVWHRDPEIAESMVDPKVYVEGVSDTGSVTTLTTVEAIELGFCEGQALNPEEVLELAGIENYRLEEFKPSGTEKIIQFLINPIVSGLLIMIIIGGLYFELQSPGVGFPLAAAVLAAILYFAPLYLEGLQANWQIAVFVAGIVLVMVEIFAIPGFGVTGVLGIAGIVIGLTFTMIDKVNFEFGPSPDGTGIKEAMASFAIVIVSIFLAFIISLWLSKKLFSPNNLLGKLALQKIQNPDEGYISFDSKKQKSLIGAKGKAHTVLRPSGKVIINDEIYDARSDIGFIEKGTDIRVIRDEAGQLYVLKDE
ncbi:MAG: nodulation protein NfeD [Bacteroidales bacterium]|nr:nodulation protein NfeD [Bacteroidales bacterium]